MTNCQICYELLFLWLIEKFRKKSGWPPLVRQDYFNTILTAVNNAAVWRYPTGRMPLNSSRNVTNGN